MSNTLTDYRRLSKLRGHRQINFIRAAIVGVAAGLLAVFFQHALHQAEALRGLVFSYAQSFPFGWPLFALFCATLGGVSAWLTVRFAPEATGSGIPHTKAVLLHLRVLPWRRVIPIKFIGGVLAIGAGFSLGREGPTVQLGAAVGAALATLLKVPRRASAHLISCGAGAGLSAAFNAPLAGFVFVIEELRRELSPLTYGTALIAAVTADIVTRAIIGHSPSFEIRNFPSLPLSALPVVLLVGVAAGIAGVAFNRLLLFSLQQVPRLRSNLPRSVRAALIGVVVAAVGWYVPDVLGPGHGAIERLLHMAETPTAPGVKYLLLLFVLKFLLTIVCYLSGVPGGIFAPLLAQGALLGLLVGSGVSSWLPEASGGPAALGVVAMAAYFAAIVRAPLTGVVLIVEMTANYDLLFVLLAASMTSYLVAEWVGEKPIYESLLQLNLSLRGPKESKNLEPILIDVVVEPRSPMDGCRVRDLELPRGCLLVTVKKGGEEHIPGGDTLLREGDEVTVVIAGERATSSSFVRSLAVAPYD
ncbi:MAG: H(+)/Cl(-) exchange transporter ClcA [Bdellovibrionales bacterium]|nr:H(+)/Cl(-) exchange transporter ClcA [Bdellovibrionales bacterium]